MNKIIKYERKYSQKYIINLLIYVYMRQCLSGANVEYITGSANTLGIIIGALGIDPSIIPREAKRLKEEQKKNDKSL